MTPWSSLDSWKEGGEGNISVGSEKRWMQIRRPGLRPALTPPGAQFTPCSGLSLELFSSEPFDSKLSVCLGLEVGRAGLRAETDAPFLLPSPRGF